MVERENNLNIGIEGEGGEQWLTNLLNREVEAARENGRLLTEVEQARQTNAQLREQVSAQAREARERNEEQARTRETLAREQNEQRGMLQQERDRVEAMADRLREAEERARRLEEGVRNQGGEREQERRGATARVALRPKQYTMGKEDFRFYIKQFTVYCDAIQIPDNERVDALYTYLDNKALRRVSTLNFEAEDKQNPEHCYEMMADLIQGHRTPAAARAELHTIEQEPEESITDFVARIMECADVGYENGEYKDKVMSDIFVRGLKSEKIMYKLLEEEADEVEPKTFEDKYKRALALEGIHLVGESIIKHKNKESKDALYGGVYMIQEVESKNHCWACKKEGNLHDWRQCPKKQQMQSRGQSGTQNVGQNRSSGIGYNNMGGIRTVKCYICGDNHYANNCPKKSDNRVCYNCSRSGHISRFCPEKTNQYNNMNGGRQYNSNWNNNERQINMSNNYNRGGNNWNRGGRNNSRQQGDQWNNGGMWNGNNFANNRDNSMGNQEYQGNYGAGGFDKRLYEGGINQIHNNSEKVAQKAGEMIQRLKSSLHGAKN